MAATQTLLTYTVLTDPTPLRTSEGGESVYLLVANNNPVTSNPVTNTTNKHTVSWTSIELTVPVGTAAEHLTADSDPLNLVFQDSSAQSPKRPQPTKTGATFKVARGHLDGGESMVLVLEKVAVNAIEGVAALTVKEKASSTTDTSQPRLATLAVQKKKASPAPEAPRNFRPDNTVVSAGSKVTLRWDGPASFTYTVLHPDGPPDRLGPGTYTWTSSAPPTQDSTYVLAATPSGAQQPTHFLTTTVHVRNPTFDSLTLTGRLRADGVQTPWVQGATDGRKSTVTFTDAGAEFRNNAGGWGTIAADKADLNGVNTEWVQGRSATSGYITFPDQGLNVSNGKKEWGIVTAAKHEITAWLQQRNPR